MNEYDRHPTMEKIHYMRLASTSWFIWAVFAGLAPSAHAKAQGFVCSTLSGVPTTLATMADGKQIPVIRWTSKVFDGAGWTPERRCQEVSARFDLLNRQGRLTYLTTGRINGQPVICTAPSNGGGCDGLLYTLKPGQNATTTLRDLLDVRLKAREPLYETNGRLYVSMDELLATPPSSGVDAAPVSNTIAPAASSSPLF
ncbi:MAG: COP23 domain-containing protein [Cyanobacteriota bacterium]